MLARERERERERKREKVSERDSNNVHEGTSMAPREADVLTLSHAPQRRTPRCWTGGIGTRATSGTGTPSSSALKLWRKGAERA